MSSSTSNSSLARSRSLKIPPSSNTLKLPSTTTPPSASRPSYITLFLTNLRLLDLELRDDWPGITAVTFSTKDAQQNQKKRVQCVEWALYQLFALWDPEETQNKLQPFFPPLEPLQSLNLRAALFRCLEKVKKGGVLGRDTVLRKTMLDECKGDRLEEVLAVFSNAVLKQVLQDENPEKRKALAHQLAVENFSYKGDKATLSSLIWIHKASLAGQLRGKAETRARYKDFSILLDLHERRIARRQEQLKQTVDESGRQDLPLEKDVTNILNKFKSNWSGNEAWMGSILQGDTNADLFLESKFEKVWRHVQNGSLSVVEGGHQGGLLEQLDRRVKTQQTRLARWQETSRSLNTKGAPSLRKSKALPSSGKKVIDLEFNQHQALRIGRATTAVNQPNPTYLHEYTQLTEDMMRDLAAVQHPKTAPRLPGELRPPPKVMASVTKQHPTEEDSPNRDEEWSSASGEEENSTTFESSIKSQTAPSAFETLATTHSNKMINDPYSVAGKVTTAPQQVHSSNEAPNSQPKISTMRKDPFAALPQEPQSPPKPASVTEDDDLAEQILESVSAASPSPKKPRHTLSLAERTRLSMSRASHSKYSDLHDNLDNFADLPNLSKMNSLPPIKLQPRSAKPEEAGLHAGLIERTRKSMAGFEAAQKKAQVERRNSVKDAKKRETESRKSHFPRVDEEVLEVSAIELLEKEGDPDYESVFKSRPKIKTSPMVSPTRAIWGYEAED